MKKIIAILIIIIVALFIFLDMKLNDNVQKNESSNNANIESGVEEKTEVANTEESTKVDLDSNENKVKIAQKEKQDYNALVIGNSLTLEKGGIGMAASDEYHDYYYLVKKKLSENYAKLNMNRISAIHWEENRIISSRTDWINENLPEETVKNLDLVIFQLGDNCVPTEQFEQSATELINHVKKYSPNAKMLWVGMWFINEERLAMLPNICEKNGVEFVNISDLVVDEYKSHVGATLTSTTGEIMAIETIEEAFHPNDEGMKQIANRIIEKLEL